MRFLRPDCQGVLYTKIAILGLWSDILQYSFTRSRHDDGRLLVDFYDDLHRRHVL